MGSTGCAAEWTYEGGDGNDVLLTRVPNPPNPQLVIERIPPASVRLLWPTNDPAFRVQSTTNLSGNWSYVSQFPLVNGTNHVIVQTTVAARTFYRLSKP